MTLATAQVCSPEEEIGNSILQPYELHLVQ
jgi:hypothetical protein